MWVAIEPSKATNETGAEFIFVPKKTRAPTHSLPDVAINFEDVLQGIAAVDPAMQPRIHLIAGSLIRSCNFPTSFLIVNAPANKMNVSADETSGTT